MPIVRRPETDACSGRGVGDPRCRCVEYGDTLDLALGASLARRSSAFSRSAFFASAGHCRARTPRWRWVVASAVAAVVLGTCACGQALAQDDLPAQTIKPPAPDFEQLIDSLASHNKAPELAPDGKSEPEFNVGFDWDDQQRVRAATDALTSMLCDDLWPHLLNHLGDDRYCLTYHGRDPHNSTVGLVCFWAAERIVAYPYVRHLRGIPEHMPIVTSPDELRDWCAERKGKSLYQLQADMARDAIRRMESNATNYVPKEVRDTFVANVRGEIRALETTKAAQFPKIRLIEEGASLYSKTQAAAIRARRGTQRDAGKPRGAN